MKLHKQWLFSIFGALVTLSINTAAWAEHPLDSPLPDWGRTGTNTVDFTNVNFRLDLGRSHKGEVEDSEYFIESTSSSVFKLNSAVNEYNDVVFNGYLVINMSTTKRGFLVPGSSFGIYSTDAMFGTDNTTEYNCNKSGNNCTTGQLVYGGEVAAFGWEGQSGVYEFEIANVTGWTFDNWGQVANTVEHILLNVEPFDTSSPTAFSTNKPYVEFEVIDGFAVVPDTDIILVYQTVSQ